MNWDRREPDTHQPNPMAFNLTNQDGSGPDTHQSNCMTFNPTDQDGSESDTHQPKFKRRIYLNMLKPSNCVNLKTKKTPK